MAHLTPHLATFFILVFLIITFGVSVIEKITDWKGTISYIEESFKQTFIKNLIKPLIVILVILETFSLFFLSTGSYQLIFGNKKTLALLGVTLSATSILYMLIGQRIAKDYPGATSLTVYFIVCVLGIFLLNLK